MSMCLQPLKYYTYEEWFGKNIPRNILPQIKDEQLSPENNKNTLRTATTTRKNNPNKHR